MRRTIMAGLVGGVVAFLWGGLSWSLLPFQTGKLKTIPNEQAVADVLARTLPDEGVYQYPGDPDPSAGEAGVREAMRRYAAGPVVPLLVFRPRSGSMNIAASIGRGLAANLLAGLLLAAVLTLASPNCDGYRRRVGLVALVATFGVLITHVPYWAWGVFPGWYTFIVTADAVIAWLLAGTATVAVMGPAQVRSVSRSSLVHV
jgi:hypothetical protein